MKLFTSSSFLFMTAILSCVLDDRRVDALVPSITKWRPTSSRPRSSFSSLTRWAGEPSTPTMESTHEPPALSAVQEIKEELMALAFRTERGFKASPSERKLAVDLIHRLARFNPTPEPAQDYYQKPIEENKKEESSTTTSASIRGKWNLIYTDAPDITSLRQNRLAELGRIGQECQPPFIKNVIEWQRPSWAASLPWSGSEASTRLLQKVVTEATASPDRPTRVNLQVAGLQLQTAADSDHPTGTDDDDSPSNWFDTLQRKGLLASLLQERPVNWQGSWRLPFGQFEILYLDEDLRVIRTNQNYYAVNKRMRGEEWF